MRPWIELGTRTLVSRLLAGEFPNYEMILPKGYPHEVQLESSELLQTARRVAVLADERNYALRCEFSAGQLRLAVDEKEEGAAEEFLSVPYEGEPVAVGLNARYLIEYLSVLGAGPLQVEFRTGREVVEFKPLGEPGFNSRMLLMPLNLAVLTHGEPEAGEVEEKKPKPCGLCEGAGSIATAEASTMKGPTPALASYGVRCRGGTGLKINDVFVSGKKFVLSASTIIPS